MVFWTVKPALLQTLSQDLLILVFEPRYVEAADKGQIDLCDGVRQLLLYQLITSEGPPEHLPKEEHKVRLLVAASALAADIVVIKVQQTMLFIREYNSETGFDNIQSLPKKFGNNDIHTSGR